MSIGIKIFGILSVIFSIYVFSFVVVPEFQHTPNLLTVAYLVTAICWLVFGAGVLMRLSWARIGLIIVAVIYIVDAVEYPSYILVAIKNHDVDILTRLVAALIYFFSLVIFFTRASVKKQFAKNQSETPEDVSSHNA